MSNQTQGKQTAVVMGKNPDGENVFLQTDADGKLKTTGGDGGGGDATAANQVTGNASLSSIDSKLTTVSTVDAKDVSTQVAAGDVGLVVNSVIHGKSTAGGGSYVDVKVSPSGAVQVGGTLDGITALPLPSGAATESTLSALNAKFSAFAFDAGARQRVSQITTLADLKTLNADDTLLLENTGTGTGAYGSNKFSMSVTSGQYYIRRSRRYYPYFSGKSQLVECTFDGFQPETNVTKRVGYFSSNAAAPYDSNKDGFWLESAGGTVTLKCSRNGTETLSVAQASFNGDILSGHDWSGFNVIAFDYLWLGGFQLRLFVKTAAGFVLAHTFAYAGTGQADTFTLSPNHCVRYEIRSTTGTGAFRYICSQVSTEGSINEAGKQFSVNTGTTGVNLAAIGTTYPLLAARKAAGFRDTPIKITDIAGFVSSNTDVLLVTLQLNPTLSAALTYAAVTNAGVERAIGNGVITVTTPGRVLSTAYLTQNSILPTDQLDEDFLSWLGETIGGTADQIVWCGTPITAGVTTFASIDLKQF